MMRSRSAARSMRCSGVLSMTIFPVLEESGSRSLSRREIRLDLPLPVRPQMATFSPDVMVRWMSRSARLDESSVWSSDLFWGQCAEMELVLVVREIVLLVSSRYAV